MAGLTLTLRAPVAPAVPKSAARVVRAQVAPRAGLVPLSLRRSALQGRTLLPAVFVATRPSSRASPVVRAASTSDEAAGFFKSRDNLLLVHGAVASVLAILLLTSPWNSLYWNTLQTFEKTLFGPILGSGVILGDHVHTALSGVFLGAIALTDFLARGASWDVTRLKMLTQTWVAGGIAAITTLLIASGKASRAYWLWVFITGLFAVWDWQILRANGET